MLNILLNWPLYLKQILLYLGIKICFAKKQKIQNTGFIITKCVQNFLLYLNYLTTHTYGTFFYYILLKKYLSTLSLSVLNFAKRNTNNTLK